MIDKSIPTSPNKKGLFNLPFTKHRNSVSNFSAMAAIVAASSTTIAVPYLTINRMAYSASSFNQQFRRKSQLAPKRDFELNNGQFVDGQSSYGDSRWWQLKAWLRWSKANCCNCLSNNNLWSNFFVKIFSNLTPFALCKRHLPAIEWISEYKLECLIPDLISGLTIAIFHIPESMGYSFLANLNPIYCLYSSVFPSLVYAFMGTSQYCSIGTFAALSIMTGTTIKETKLAIHRDLMLQQQNVNEFLEINYTKLAINGVYSSSNTAHTLSGDFSIQNQTDPNSQNEALLGSLLGPSTEIYSNAEIAFVCSFIVGIYHLLFGLFRFGFISVYMSEQFLSGFTCAVAYHVFCSQLRHMLGFQNDSKFNGQSFVLFQYLSNVFHNLPNIHLASLLISLITVLLLLLSKWYLDRWLYKLTSKHILFPMEFIIVISGILISKYFDLSSQYQVQIVGPIEQGLPKPRLLPVASLFGYLWQPCISIAVVSYAITYSVGRTLSQLVQNDNRKSSNGEQMKSSNENLMRTAKEINPSQELVALGCSNLLGSIFSCIPSGASLSRSAIQFGSGCRTQLVSLVNCACILIFLIFFSSFLETLPNAILATIIAFALRNLLASVGQFGKYWNISRVDASVWIVTFLSVIIIDINWGVYLGLLYSLLTLIYKSQLPPTYLLGSVGANDQYSSLDFFVPLDQYVNARELEGIKIFQFCGPLHFANVDFFVSQLEAKLKFSIKELIKIKSTLIQLNKSNELIKYDSNKLLVEPNNSQVINIERTVSNGCNVDKVLANGNELDLQGQTNQEDYTDNDDNDDDDDEFDEQLINPFMCSNTANLCSLFKTNGLAEIGASMGIGPPQPHNLILARRYRRYLKRMLPHFLIIDCSMVSYIDTDGMKTLKRLIADFDYLGVKVFLGGCPFYVSRLLERFNLQNDSNNDNNQIIYISVPDAIEHARQQQKIGPVKRPSSVVQPTENGLGKLGECRKPFYTSFPSHLNESQLSNGVLPQIVVRRSSLSLATTIAAAPTTTSTTTPTNDCPSSPVSLFSSTKSNPLISSTDSLIQQLIFANVIERTDDDWSMNSLENHVLELENDYDINVQCPNHGQVTVNVDVHVENRTCPTL